MITEEPAGTGVIKPPEAPTRGTLALGEPHPSACLALDYVRNLGLEKLTLYQDAFASTSLSGNRLSEVCSDTLNRVLTGAPVGDRYILGLAWAIRNLWKPEDAG